jgi:predicted nucleotidyltransferase
VKTALKRREAFRNLAEHLKTIRRIVHKLDPEAEAFVFGSVAEKKHNYSSDIDVLIVTRMSPAEVSSELWKAGIREPFEIHVHTPEEAVFYQKRVRLIKI